MAYWLLKTEPEEYSYFDLEQSRRDTTPPYPDPENNSLYVVEVAPRYRLNLPVSLREIKQDPGFSGWKLVRLPRLSVMPVPEEHWISVTKWPARKPDNLTFMSGRKRNYITP